MKTGAEVAHQFLEMKFHMTPQSLKGKIQKEMGRNVDSNDVKNQLSVDVIKSRAMLRVVVYWLVKSIQQFSRKTKKNLIVVTNVRINSNHVA